VLCESPVTVPAGRGVRIITLEDPLYYCMPDVLDHCRSSTTTGLEKACASGARYVQQTQLTCIQPTAGPERHCVHADPPQRVGVTRMANVHAQLQAHAEDLRGGETRTHTLLR
jgi:hypothetical protein